MPSNVPAPPILALPEKNSIICFKRNKSAPIRGPKIPAQNATAGGFSGVRINPENAATTPGT